MSELELHQRAAKELGVSLERVIEYDKLHWKCLKYDLNNPTFDVMEVPFFGAFKMTKPRFLKALRYSFRQLKGLNKKTKKYPHNEKLMKEYESAVILFKNLWKLKQQVYGFIK